MCDVLKLQVFYLSILLLIIYVVFLDCNKYHFITITFDAPGISTYIDLKLPSILFRSGYSFNVNFCYNLRHYLKQ